MAAPLVRQRCADVTANIVKNIHIQIPYSDFNVDFNEIQKP